MALFLVYKIYKLLKKINQIQFKINSKGIQYREKEFVSWNNIENERITSELINDEETIYYFKYYISDRDERISVEISDLNINVQDLERAIRIHRNRFNKENND